MILRSRCGFCLILIIFRGIRNIQLCYVIWTSCSSRLLIIYIYVLFQIITLLTLNSFLLGLMIFPIVSFTTIHHIISKFHCIIWSLRPSHIFPKRRRFLLLSYHLLSSYPWRWFYLGRINLYILTIIIGWRRSRIEIIRCYNMIILICIVWPLNVYHQLLRGLRLSN